MNQRTLVLQEKYKPQVAVVVYKGDGSNYYLESHDINEQGQILSGKPLMQETLQGMVNVFFDERMNRTKISGYIPGNMLQFEVLPGGHFNMVWWRPEEIRMMHFNKQLKLRSGMTWVPALLYKLEHHTLSVYALKKNKRPVERTQLYRAPFHNIYENGAVCLGNAKVKKPTQLTYANVIQYWEDMFWKSEFSHLNGAKNPTKTPLGKLWTQFIKSKKKLKWSKVDELIAIAGKKTINDSRNTIHDEEEDEDDDN